MADIFISYARADQDRIGKLASSLEAEGWSVWWDLRIAGGAEFSKEIERELEAAKAVLVAWSKESVESRWVKDEAGLAAEAGKLVTISLDGAAPPIGFKQFHATHWEGGGAAAIAEIKRSISLKINRSTAAASETSKHPIVLTQKPLFTAGLAVLVVLASAAFLGMRDRRDGIASSPAAAGLHSIAVLPFADLSPNRDQEYFSDGIAEELLNLLAKETNLRVAARTSSFSFKDRKEDANAIGEALNVDALVEGSVRKAGENVRITVQLVDAGSGFHLWSQTYDRTLADIFAVQDEIATALVGAIPSVTSTASGEARPLEDSAAYDLVLQGRHQLTLRTPASVSKARALFEEASEVDPDFAPAWAGRATAYALQRDTIDTYGHLSYAESLTLAEPAIERALTLDPESDEALAAKGLLALHGNDTDRAEEALRRAIAINPSSINARNWLHTTLMAEQRYREAFEEIVRAAEIDPLSAIILENLVNAHVLRGNYEAAVSVAQRNAALNSQWPVVRASLAYALFSAGQFAEGLAAEEEIFSLEDVGAGGYGNATFRLTIMQLFDEDKLNRAPWYALSFARLIQGRTEAARDIVTRQYAEASDKLAITPRVAWTLWAVGEEAEARALYEQYAASETRPPLVSTFDCFPGLHIAALRQRAGDQAGARPLVEACRRVIERQNSEGLVLPYFRSELEAELLLREGERAAAIDHLRKVADARRSVGWWIHMDPAFAELKDDPRFHAVVSDIKSMVDAEREVYLQQRTAVD
ncbi:MAG: TIR domain-containing protein [Pseudomonadota bacterium]